MLFQFEADRSTDEDVHGDKDENDEGLNTDSDSEDDRHHVGAFEATQAPTGYNQRAIYMQSLLTQAAPGAFKEGRSNSNPFPGVGGRFGAKHANESAASRENLARRPVLLSSDAARQEEDRYSMDSFVCDDEMVEYDDGWEAAQAESEL